MRMPAFNADVGLQPARGGAILRAGLDIGDITVCKCAPACRRVTICLFNYCTEVTICDDCAYTYDCYVIKSR